MLLQVLGSAKNPKKKEGVLDIMGIERHENWWSQVMVSAILEQSLSSPQARLRIGTCYERKWGLWPTESVGDKNSTRDGHPRWSCALKSFNVHIWSWKWSPPGRWFFMFFLVMVIGWVFGGWRKPVCGFQITDDWLIDPTNIIGPVEFMLKDVPKICGGLHARCSTAVEELKLANRSNGDDFRWSKAAVETAWKRNKHRYSQMCSLDTSKVK